MAPQEVLRRVSSRQPRTVVPTLPVGHPRVVAALLAGYLGVIALLTLDPSAEVASHGASLVERLLVRLDAPTPLLAPGRPEVLCNVVMLVPVPLLGRFLLRSLDWRDWTAYGFVFSAAVESAQGLFLAHRGATAVDVVANTAGTAIGAVLATAVATILRLART